MVYASVEEKRFFFGDNLPSVSSDSRTVPSVKIGNYHIMRINTDSLHYECTSPLSNRRYMRWTLVHANNEMVFFSKICLRINIIAKGDPSIVYMKMRITYQ